MKQFLLLVGFLVLALPSLQAKKIYKKKTGKKCLFCHTSRKGGEKKLTTKGRTYENYRFLRRQIYKKKLEMKELSKEKRATLKFWKKIEKEQRKIRRNRRKKK